MKCFTFKVLILKHELVLEEGKIKTEDDFIIPDVQYTRDTWQNGGLTGIAEDLRTSESLTKKSTCISFHWKESKSQLKWAKCPNVILKQNFKVLGNQFKNHRDVHTPC